MVMAWAVQKTPVSELQELCVQRGYTPTYTEGDIEGAQHEPLFTCFVKAGAYEAEGQGTSKKIAKHNAAAALLEQMGSLGSLETKLQARGGEDSNPIGELQEYSQKRRWAPPVYELTHEGGPPHAPLFSCKVSLGNHSAMQRASSKKSAKHKAASDLLKMLKSDGEAGELGLEANLEDSMRQLYVSVKNGPGVTGLTPEASLQVTEFYTRQRQAGINGNLPESIPRSDAETLLKDVAKRHGFEATFVVLEELSDEGDRQCLLQIAALPVAVCFGTGSSLQDARNNAAHAALLYLRIMTKSGQPPAAAESSSAEVNNSKASYQDAEQ